MESIATFCIRPPCEQTIFSRTFRERPRLFPLHELAQFAPLFTEFLTAHISNNPTRVFLYHETPIQHLHTLSERIKSGLLVQYQSCSAREERHNLSIALLQNSLVWMYQHKIIHIPQVVLYPQPFLDKMIEVIQYAKLNQLTDLTSESDAHVTVERINHVTDCFRRPLVVNTLHDRSFCHIMTGGWKELSHIAFQYPSISAML